MCSKTVSTVSGLHLAILPHTPARSGSKIASTLDTYWTGTSQSLKVIFLSISLKLLSVGCQIISCTSLARVVFSICFLVNPLKLLLTVCNMENPTCILHMFMYSIRLYRPVSLWNKIPVPFSAWTTHSLRVLYVTRYPSSSNWGRDNRFAIFFF